MPLSAAEIEDICLLTPFISIYLLLTSSILDNTLSSLCSRGEGSGG